MIILRLYIFRVWSQISSFHDTEMYGGWGQKDQDSGHVCILKVSVLDVLASCHTYLVKGGTLKTAMSATLTCPTFACKPHYLDAESVEIKI